MTRTARPDVYQTITAKIVAAVEARPGDPVMPWQRGGFNAVLPKNAVTNNDYRGINILSLWVTALDRGYEAGLFATYKQWAAIGAQVRKGESAAPIVFYRQLEIAGVCRRAGRRLHRADRAAARSHTTHRRCR